MQVVVNPSQPTVLGNSEGHRANTPVIVAAYHDKGSVSPRLLGPIGSCLYVTTSDPDDRLMRLYRFKVDDTGSVRVRHVTTLPNRYAAEPDSDPYVTTFAVAGKKLFFDLNLGSGGPTPRDAQLWVTDGTRSGTKMLHRPLSFYDEFGTQIYALDDRVLFTGAEGMADLEPWISDGTVRGTRRLQDIAPGGSSSFPGSFTRVGSRVFFIANDRVHGNELWAFPLRYPHSAAEE